MNRQQKLALAFAMALGLAAAMPTGARAEPIDIGTTVQRFTDDALIETLDNAALETHPPGHRPDGQGSVSAEYDGGVMITKPLVFSGRRLVLNYATSAAGSVQVEIQDAHGVPIPGFTLAESRVRFFDEIYGVMAWRAVGTTFDNRNISDLRNTPVRIKFVLKDAKLYSMWFGNPDNPTYNVTYNNNGADRFDNGNLIGRAPSTQRKEKDVPLVLAMNFNLVKEGHFFDGWNTQADGNGTDYPACGEYTGNAAMTLYAKWTALPDAYRVSFDGNGATGGWGPAWRNKFHDVALTLPSSVTLARTGHTFAGWNTAADGSGADYAAGAVYTDNAPVTLYAKWADAIATTRDERVLFPGTGWQYAESGTRDTHAPPSTGWSSTPLQWPNLYWQRLDYTPPAEWEGRRILLRVGAVAYGTTVYVNGHRVGENRSAPTAYEVDITDYLAWPGSNQILLGLQDWTAYLDPAVQPDNNGLQLFHVPNPSVQGPIGYALWLYQHRLWHGGVRLKAVPAVRVDDVFVRPSVRQARLEADYVLRNDGTEPRTVTLGATVLPRGSDEVVKTLPAMQVTVPAGGTATGTLSTAWADALLWSPRTPHLYLLDTLLTDGDTALDTIETRFGFREFWIEASPDGTRSWFMLNGHRQALRGDGMWHPYLGDDYVHTLIGWLKEHNFNMLRISNGGLPSYYDLADELGILVQSEIPFMFNHKYHYTPLFWQRAEHVLTEQIRAYRNHPSVVFWGVENEVMLDSPGQDIGGELFALQQTARALDPTRAVMHEGDADLRITGGAESAVQDVQVINIHDYEVEPGRAGGVMSVLDFPQAAYAFGQAVNAAQLPGVHGSALPDKSKPWVIGEYGPGAIFNHPHGLAFLKGDATFVDLFGAARGLMEASGQYYGFQIDGYRYFDHIAGIAPWATYYGDPSIGTGPVLRRFFRPVTTRVKEGRRTAFGGAPVERTLTIYNDDVTETSNFDLNWRVTHAETTLTSGQMTFSAEPGFPTRRTLSFTAPTPPPGIPRVDATLVLELHRNGHWVDTEERPLALFPARAPVVRPHGVPVYLWQHWFGGPGEALTAAGVDSIPVTGPLDLSGRDPGLLILGHGTAHDVNDEAKREAMRAWTQAGGTILVVADHGVYPPWVLSGVAEDYRPQPVWGVPAAIGFNRAPHHPVLTGLGPDDFQWWGDNTGAELIPPMHRWWIEHPEGWYGGVYNPKAWGADHLVVGGQIGNVTKPSAGLARVLVDTGGRNLGLGDAPLVEFPHGRGSTFVNRLLMFEKINEEPVARALLQNILNVADAARSRLPAREVAVLAENSTAMQTVLDRMGVPHVNLAGQLGSYTAESLAAQFGVIIVHEGSDTWTQVVAHQTTLQGFVQAGGHAIIRRVNSAIANEVAALIGAPVTVRDNRLRHPQLEKTRAHPTLDGISNDDSFWAVPTGYRTQDASAVIVDQVVQVDQHVGVMALFSEPRRTGVLAADSGQSYNIGAADRDVGVAIQDPAHGLVRVQPPGASGAFYIDQVLWDGSLNLSVRRKAQRLLSALLTNLLYPPAPPSPLRPVPFEDLTALLHFIPEGGGPAETVALGGQGVLGVHAGWNGETTRRDTLGRDWAESGLLALELEGISSAGRRVRADLDPCRPSLGWVREQTDRVRGRLDVPPFAPDGQMDGELAAHLRLEVDDAIWRHPTAVLLRAGLGRFDAEPGDIFGAPNASVGLVNADDQPSGLFLQWEGLQLRPPADPPWLDLRLPGAGSLSLRWPAPATWVVETRISLTTGDWTIVPGPYLHADTEYQLTVPTEDDASRFFRLRRGP